MKMNELIVGKYKIIELLGNGGQGRVYKVLDINLEVIYVAKEIASIDANEIRILKQLDYPYIPRIIDIIYGDRVYVIMTYIEGVTLNKYIKGSDLSFDEKLDLSRKLCASFAYLHTLPIPVCYLDAKPQNIIIDSKKNVWLIDFDSARLLHDTDNIHIFSTKGYAAPELFIGRFGTESDVYSVGRLIMYILTETESGDYSYSKKMLKDTGISKNIYKLIEKSIEADEKKRFHNCKFLLDKLKEINARRRLNGIIIYISNELFMICGVICCSAYLSGLYYKIHMNTIILIIGFLLLIISLSIEHFIGDKKNKNIKYIDGIDLSDKEFNKILYNTIVQHKL